LFFNPSRKTESLNSIFFLGKLRASILRRFRYFNTQGKVPLTQFTDLLIMFTFYTSATAALMANLQPNMGTGNF